MHGLNQYDYSARYYDPAISRFTTIDPLSEKYYSISPYVYVANNPLKYVDPTGMFIDDYYQTEDGRITLARRTNDNFDRLYGKDGNQIKVEDKSILPQLANSTGNESFKVAETSSLDDAINIFKFSADNTKVEWGLDGYKTSQGKSRYVLRTSFSDEGVFTRHNLYSNEEMTFTIHSHPGNNGTKGASGYIDVIDGSFRGGDMRNLGVRYNDAKGANKKFPEDYPRHYIYHQQTQNLYYYNYKTTNENLGSTLNPKELQLKISNFNKYIYK